MLYSITGAHMNPQLSHIEDEVPMQELKELLDIYDSASSERPCSARLEHLRVAPGLEELEFTNILDLLLSNSIVYRAKSKSIWQYLKQKESERNQLIANRLKKEAKVFELIKYANHLISIYPKLQIMNYIRD